MKRFRLLYAIIRMTGLIRILLIFVCIFVLAAAVIVRVEPDIDTIGESMWYCFASCTTIGYGDVVAVTTVGRVMAAAVSLFGIMIVAFIPAIAVNYYTELVKMQRNESMVMFMDRLENLDKMTEEELREISREVRRTRRRIRGALSPDMIRGDDGIRPEEKGKNR